MYLALCNPPRDIAYISSIVGYYCESWGMTNVTGLCAPGFFCTQGANSSIPTDGTTGKILGKDVFNFKSRVCRVCSCFQYCPPRRHNVTQVESACYRFGLLLVEVIWCVIFIFLLFN